ncbi:hypothetical protein RBH29_03190 [Herbivorax sp. ANBcel31]|uniref:4'-phosphopantetheinyl transferase family protein n=1 Tax=Herbivorax sp. ANBcel31 TaxID=3069754 RepID=UPI0027AFF713|nr:hypothetical protein [Herbivorax sp. ANBcel31]MDQ2085440.1 hypothetical protein [Herbivorax sp. ANBcel31]
MVWVVFTTLEDIHRCKNLFDEYLLPNSSDKAKERYNLAINKKKAQSIIVAEQLLKYIVAKTLNINMNEVFIDKKQSDNGKPSINNNNFNISVSHSDNYIMGAISNNKIGCDVQRVNYSRKIIPKGFFTEDDMSYIFFSIDYVTEYHKIWTRKESYFKLNGRENCDSKINFSNSNDVHLCNKFFFHTEFIEKDVIATICTNLFYEKIQFTQLNVVDFVYSYR